MKIVVDANGCFLKVNCCTCGHQFKLGDPQPVFVNDDGVAIGDICHQCFPIFKRCGEIEIENTGRTVAEEMGYAPSNPPNLEEVPF